MTDLPKRKDIRVKGYDYSQNGAYFVTICVKDRRKVLGQIVTVDDIPTVTRSIVGDGVLDVPHLVEMQLSDYGIIVNDRILSINDTYEHIDINKYVIMPNHIHMIVMVYSGDSGTSRTPSPTNAVIPALVSTLKRFTNKECGFSLWQRSYHDHIIRNEAEYREIWQYIDAN